MWCYEQTWFKLEERKIWPVGYQCLQALHPLVKFFQFRLVWSRFLQHFTFLLIQNRKFITGLACQHDQELMLRQLQIIVLTMLFRSSDGTFLRHSVFKLLTRNNSLTVIQENIAGWMYKCRKLWPNYHTSQLEQVKEIPSRKQGFFCIKCKPAEKYRAMVF